MKVLLITEYFPPKIGGTPVKFYKTYKYYPDNSVYVLTDTYVGGGGEEKNGKMFVRRVSLKRRDWMKPFNFLDFCIRAIFYGYWIVKRNKITEVHCARPYPEGLIGIILKWIFDTPVFCYVQGEELKIFEKYPIERKINELVLSNSSGVIANSSYSRNLAIKNGAKPENSVVIHPGVDLQLFHPNVECQYIRKLYDLEQKRILLSVGRLEARKGHDMVIMILTRLLELFPETVYVIVGDGDERNRLESLAKEEKVDHAVIFTGYVSEESLPAFFNVCDFFVHPNRELESGSVEGFGQVFIQANACGKAVIGGNSGGVVDAIIHNKTGLLINPNNEEELLNAIIDLFQNPKKAEGLGRMGRIRAMSQFPWSKVSSNVKKFCKERISNERMKFPRL